MLVLTEMPLSIEELQKKVIRPNTGAVASFVGVTRNHNLGEPVETLFYEAYVPMALKEMKRLVKETKDRFGVIEIAIYHRLGRVGVGEASLAIAVSSAHRQAAFEACQYVVDRLKEQVPIFKKEFFGKTGARWVPNRTT